MDNNEKDNAKSSEATPQPDNKSLNSNENSGSKITRPMSPNEEKLMNTQVSLKIIPEQKKGLYDTLILRLEKIIKRKNSFKKESSKKITNIEHNTKKVRNLITLPINKNNIHINVNSKTFFLQQRNLTIIALNNITNNIDCPKVRKHSRKIDLSSIGKIHVNNTNYSKYRDKLNEYATKKMYNQYAPKETVKYKIYKYSIITSALVFIIALFSIVNWIRQGIYSKEVLKDITNDLIIEEIDSNVLYNIDVPESEFKLTSIYWKYLETPLYSVDLNDLRKENKDTIGWLFVNNTNINYPVVQTNNNDYYLTHSFTKQYNSAGWIYADFRDRFDDFNKNMVIYGHGRYDKVMFGSLTNTLKKDWYTDPNNQIIQLSTIKYNTMWQIFSIYKIPSESYYITTDFGSDTSYGNFLNEMKKRSIYDFGVNLTTKDKILTLSTCYNDNGIRLVVQAKLVKIQER
jgi:sortase B